MSRRIVSKIVVIAAALACSNAVGPEDLRGVWGTEGALLSVGETEATLQTSCWVGRFTVPTRFNDDGSFQVEGTTTAQGGAPPVEPPQPQPATFVGRIHGNLLTLAVSRSVADYFALRRGVHVQVPGCP